MRHLSTPIRLMFTFMFTLFILLSSVIKKMYNHYKRSSSVTTHKPIYTINSSIITLILCPIYIGILTLNLSRFLYKLLASNEASPCIHQIVVRIRNLSFSLYFFSSLLHEMKNTRNKQFSQNYSND